MNLAVWIALFSLSSQLAIAAAMYLLARAPGWERVRALVLVALSAAMYNVIDVWATAAPRPVEQLGWVIRANVFNGAVHVSAWLWYTFADETGAWKRLPLRIRQLFVVNLGIAAIGSGTGIIVSHDVPFRMLIPALGVDYAQPRFSPSGNVISAWLLFVLSVSFYEHLKRARRGVPGSRGLVVGFLLFILLAGEEVLVTAGVINFLFLADVGFLCVVVPVGIQLAMRFIEDAHRLRDLSLHLASEVKQRTSERDAAREALLEQERLAALGRLAAGVGHEINNPLQYLFLSLDALRDSHAVSNTAERESIRYAIDAAERIRRVVEGLRVYSRGDAEAFSVVRMADVVEHAMRVASPQLRTGAKVMTTLDAAPDVLGDEARLVQVVVNPLVNAAQSLTTAGVSTPSIRIHLRTTDAGDAELEITDNGPGFAPDVLPNLGTPYVTTKTGIGGTGLGLFISRGIIEAHGGTLILDNVPGGGARVRIRLPQWDQPSGETAGVVPIAEPTPVRGAGRHVLVVDDEAAVRAVLERGLTKRGYHVTTADDGEHALSLLGHHEVDVVISDVMMPRMSGIELADALAEAHPQLRRRFIVISGGAVSPAAEAFLQRDDLVICEKPISLEQLCQAIESLSPA